MGLGVLNGKFFLLPSIVGLGEAKVVGVDRKLSHVPGTVLLDDQAAHVATSSGLKHGKGRNGRIVLAPQPSDSPNDPLNWPLWKKEINIYILCFGAVLNCATNVGARPGHGP